MPKRISIWMIWGWFVAAIIDSFLPHPTVYRCDPISSSILISLAISAATTAASVGLEYLAASRRKVPPVDRGKMDDIRISVPGYGEPILRGWGLFRTAPVWFWHTPIVHSTIETPGRSGGKGSPKPPTPTTVDHIYTTSLAGVICEGPISSIRRIWFDNDLVWNTVTTGNNPLSASRYEAESATLAGGANSVASSACSGGFRVQGIGSGGTVQFSVTVSATANYEIGVFYTSTADRTFKVSVNGGANTDLVCLSTGGVNIVGIQTMTVALNNGANTILFSNSGAAAPDLDKLEIAHQLELDPSDPIDRRRFTGLVNPNMIAPSDPDIQWPYYNERPAEVASVYSTNLAKYGQPSIRIYTGTETQTADPAIIADKGASNAPAYRGVAYLVIEGMQLQARRIPNVTVEVDQGTTTVSTIVQDIYGLVGVASANLTLTALSGDTITGFVIPSRKSAADAIAELQTRFQFDLPEVDGKVKAIKRNGTSDLTIPYSELRAHLDGEEMPAFDALITDIDPLLLPKRVDVNYQDPEMDYHNNTQSDMRLTGPQYDEQTVSLSIIDSATNVKKLASILLYKPELEGRSFKFTTGPKYMRVHPGSVVTLTLPNSTHTVRVTEAKYQLPAGVCEFEGVRQQASVYSPTGTGSISTGYEAPIAPIPASTKGVIIDGPILRPEDGGDGTQPVVYVAMCGRGAGTWPGGFLYQEFPIGSDNYSFVTASDKPSNIGVTSGTLAGTWLNSAGATVSDASVWDRTNSLIVNFLSNTELSSATEQDLLANPELNLLAFINPSTNAVEYVQFKTATAGVASTPYFSQYTISTFLRGRVATDGNVGNHTSLDDVVVIDSTVKPRRMNLVDVGRPLKFKFVSSGQAEEDASTVTQTLQGNSLKPLAPINVTGTRNASGDLLIQWTRRTRIGAGLIPSAGTALAEESESFLVEIYSGSTLLRTMPVAPAATQTALWQPRDSRAVISGGTLSTSGVTGDPVAEADVAQKIPSAGGFLEFTTGMVSATGTRAILTTLWPSDYPQYELRIVHSGGGHADLFHSYRDVTGVTSILVASTPCVDGDRLRVLNVGTELRFYKNYTAIGVAPFYVSPIATFYPLRFRGIIFSPAADSIESAVIYTGKPGTIYSSGQQVSDFGSTQSSITVRIRQVSAIVGPGPYVEATI